MIFFIDFLITAFVSFHPDVEPLILLANHYYLRKMSVDGKNYERVTDANIQIGVFDFDYREEKIYFTDYSTSEIKRMGMDGQNIEVIDIHFSSGVEGMALDWVGR